jgi:ATP-dependent Clp protease ATP-binding subunit ClpA
MREFVFGTQAQYNWLENLLQDGQCHVFNDSVLPASCTPDRCRLGFEKAGSAYIAEIDRGITTTSDDPNFVRFLQNGESRFTCMEDMVDFFHALQPLFADSAQQPGFPVAAMQGAEEDAVDMNALIDEQRKKSRKQLLDPGSISTPLKQKIFGQDEAIDTLAELIACNHMRKQDKLLVAMLLGPTATGKSETAKSLAEVLTNVTGTKYGFIELAGSEFVGEHSVNRFFGAPPGYVGHGQPTALEAARKKPCCIVINELEKADPKLIEGLMEAIDTGYLGMADNSKPIDLNRCILLLTSNLPIPMDEYEAANEFQRSEICRDAFTKYCGRPEISGKIGNFIVYQKLSVEANARIILKFIRQELDNYDLKLGKIEVPLMQELLARKSCYGARAIAITVSTTIGKQLQRQLLNGADLDAMAGKTVSISGPIDHIQFEIN